MFRPTLISFLSLGTTFANSSKLTNKPYFAINYLKLSPFAKLNAFLCLLSIMWLNIFCQVWTSKFFKPRI